MKDLGIGIYKISLMAYPKARVLYVGQSKYLAERMRDHRNSLRVGKHHNPHLQNIYNKHGLAGFRFEVICSCNIGELDALEKFYIDELKPECNIIIDPTKLWEKRYDEQPAIISFDLPGLEMDYKPLLWHRAVYGDGNREMR